MIRKDGKVLGGKGIDTTSESFRAIVGHSTSACARYLIERVGQERADKFDTLHRMITSDARKFRFAIEEYLLRQCDLEELQSMYQTYFENDTYDESFQSVDQFVSTESLDDIQWLEMGVTIGRNGHSEDDLADIFILGGDYGNLYYGYDNATRFLVREITCTIMDMVALNDPDDLDSQYYMEEITETLDLLYEMNMINDIFNN